MIQNEFGTSVDTSNIKIYNKNFVPEVPLSPFNNQTMAPNGNIYYGDTSKFSEDFSQEKLPAKATFIHEIAHIQQTQDGKGNLIDNKLAGLVTGGSYDPNDRLQRDQQGNVTSDWDDFNIEQKATLVEGRYVLKEQGPLRKRNQNNGQITLDLSNFTTGDFDAIIPF